MVKLVVGSGRDGSNNNIFVILPPRVARRASRKLVGNSESGQEMEVEIRVGRCGGFAAKKIDGLGWMEDRRYCVVWLRKSLQVPADPPGY